MFERRPLEVAPALLGWRLRSEIDGEAVEAVITETEAYEHAGDPASHAHHPVDGIRRSERNAAMFSAPGRLYVYRSYGIHWCANVVCWPEGEPGAVLLRAVDVLHGHDVVERRRPGRRSDRDRTGGPGRLCVALAIDGDHDGIDLLDPGSSIRLAAPAAPLPADRIVAGPRIGISTAAERPWRFGVRAHPTLSKPFR